MRTRSGPIRTRASCSGSGPRAFRSRGGPSPSTERSFGSHPRPSANRVFDEPNRGGGMSVEFTGRHAQWTPTLRELAEERAQRLERHLGGPASVRVVLSQEKHRFGAEVIATHRRRRWKAQEETADLRAAMTLAFEKIDAQAKRDSEKRRDRKHRGAVAAASLEPAPGPRRAPPAAPARRIVPIAQRSAIKPMTVEEAAM